MYTFRRGVKIDPVWLRSPTPGAEPGNSFAPAVGGGNSHQFCQQARSEAGGAAEEYYQDGTPAELSQPEEGAEEKSGTQPLKELFAQTGATHGRTPVRGWREYWRIIPHW